MSRPLFSCVMPVKGARPYFEQALDSLGAQGLGSELEIIVQDGDVESDHGQSEALNRGFAKARGEWLFWLNADDILLPGALRRVAEMFSPREPACTSGASPDWIAGNMVMIDKDGRVLRCLRDRGSRAAYEGRPIRVFGPSSFFRRELLDESGGFDPTLKVAMDTDLWMRFRERGHWFVKTGDYLFGFRIHAGSATMNPAKSAETQAEHAREVARVHAAHHVDVDAAYLRRRHLQRLLDGSYVREVFDTWRFRGKDWREVFR